MRSVMVGNVSKQSKACGSSYVNSETPDPSRERKTTENYISRLPRGHAYHNLSVLSVPLPEFWFHWDYAQWLLIF